MNAVFTHHLSFIITVYQVLIILFNAFVRFLDTTSGRSIITGHRQTNHRPVRQINGTLYQAFTKAAPAHNDSSVPILNSSRHNLTGRSREFIDQYNQTTILELARTFSKKFTTGITTAFRIDYQFLFAQKLVGNIDGSVQITSAIALQIKNQIFHPFFLQFS